MRAFVIYGKKMTDNIAMFIFKVFFYLLFVGIISQTYNIDKKSAIIFYLKLSLHIYVIIIIISISIQYILWAVLFIVMYNIYIFIF
jgi:hypothetical protein